MGTQEGKKMSRGWDTDPCMIEHKQGMARRLWRLCEAERWDGRKLAAELGMSSSAVYNLLHARCVPKPGTIYKLLALEHRLQAGRQ